MVYSLSFILTLISFTKYVLLIFGSWKERTLRMFRTIYNEQRYDSKRDKNNALFWVNK